MSASKMIFWIVAVTLASAAWWASIAGSIEFDAARSKEAALIAAEASPLGQPPGKEEPPKTELVESYPKYNWAISPATDATAVGTHAVVESANGTTCDLSPGWHCDLIATADKDGKVALPIQWRRPLDDKLRTAIASHPYGDSMSLGPKGATVSGFAPGEKLRLRVGMGVYTNAQGENSNQRRAYLNDAGLADCLDVCLLSFSKFEHVAEPLAPQGPAAPRASLTHRREPAPADWVEKIWPSGWTTILPPLAILLLAALPPWAMRALRILRVAAGFPPRALTLAYRTKS